MIAIKYWMSPRECILSDKKEHRLLRHLSFWLLWGGYFSMTRHLNPLAYMTTGKFPELYKSVVESFFFLLPQTFLVYPVLYYVLPAYIFKQKYIQGLIWFILFFLIALFIHSFVVLFIPWDKIPWISNAKLLVTTNTFQEKFFLAYLASLQGALTGVALASSFKMFKRYYSKSLHNQQ